MGANEKHEATYHGGEYTPTLGHVRTVYISHKMDCRDESKTESMVQAEFDRWLETVRAEAKAEALRDLADTGLESKKISKFQAAWIRGLAREYTQGPHKIVGAFATPETNKENTP